MEVAKVLPIWPTKSGHFSTDYQVVVADSRAHGRSGMTDEQMTYKIMAQDWVALINHLKLPPVRLVGWSDGGNISLEIARTHPSSVDRVAVMGANLSPDRSAVHSWAVDWVLGFSQEIDAKIAAGDTEQNWQGPQAAILSIKRAARYVLGRARQH